MYVHLTEPRDIEQYQRVTVLRISGTPKPIPSFEEGLLDIGLSTDGWTTSWNGKDGHLAPEYDERVEGRGKGDDTSDEEQE